MRLRQKGGFERMGAAVLLGCVGLFVWRTRAWPLVNDPALMHYVVFLMGKGMAPYREIGDINLAGAYVPEWVSMGLAHLLHVSDARMWRGMDLLALLLAGWAMVLVARPWSWFAGVWAGCLFALYHGRDGVGQAGQRDLWMTVLLLWAVAALVSALRGVAPGWRAGCFGLLVGAACTVKPVAAPFLLLLVPVLLRERRVRLLVWAGVGFLLPLLAMVLFVAHRGALPAFWEVLRVTLPYHASLGDGSVWQLLRQSTLSSLGKLLLVLLAVELLAARGRRGSPQPLRTGPSGHGDWAERLVPAACVALGLFCFVIQGKGYPYQRYPYVAFLLLFLALEFAFAVKGPGKPLRAAGAAGFMFGVLFCAPSYLRGAVQTHWFTPVGEMEAAIRAESGRDEQVQCLDVISGCTDALLHLRLREATGILYDEFLFPQTPSGWGLPYTGPAPGAPTPRAVVLGREKFRAELARNPPRLIVLSAWLFPQGPGEYRELALWPWFDGYLREHYTLRSEQSFPRAENGPLGFRVYVRRFR